VNLLSILSGLLKLAVLVGEIMRDRQLLDAGEQKAIAKSLLAVADAVGVGQAVEDEIAAMTDEQVDAALEEDFRG
jgi:hypothetical protein